MAEEALRQAADAIIREARERKASDIHISEGMPIWYRVNGRLLPAQTQMSAEEIRGMLYAIMPKNLKKDLMQIFPFRLPMDIARG